jgi:CRISPR-associated endonuclease Csn1
LRNTERRTYFDKENKQVTRDVFTEFKKPWNNFTIDTQKELEKIVVSFKQNLRVINKTTNKYYAYDNGKKVLKKQEKGDGRTVRKPLHKDTVFAKVYLLNETKEITLQKALEKVNELKDVNIIVDKALREKIKEYYKENNIDINLALKDEYLKNNPRIKIFEIQTATRKSLDTSFTEKIIKESVTDNGIQKILLNHLLIEKNNPEIAFSPEGIEKMNKNIIKLNDEKYHQPIYKVRKYESFGNKFQVGTTGNKRDKYVEAEKGTNLFFAVYVNKEGKRSYETIPLNIAIKRMKQGLNAVPERNDKGDDLLFYLSPNDLVYVPTEKENGHTIDWKNLDKEQLNRIYKMVSCTGNQCFFIRHNVATSIVNKVEFSPLNKMEKNIDEMMIKECCIKLKIDSLGNIKQL